MQKTKSQYEAFLKRIDKELLQHPIIVNNEYCKWFRSADLDRAEVAHFAVQFSVFSNLFLIAQLKKMINSSSLESMRASKEILASELGAIFNNKNKINTNIAKNSNIDKEMEGDPELVSTEGTIDGGRFKFEAAHFEWMLNFGKPLGLKFSDLGKRKHGTPSTLFFCDELDRIYGSEDYSTSAGASYAVENWAAKGFWKDLVTGLKAFKMKHEPSLHLGFFTWHDKVEDQHAKHTQEELAEAYFDENNFIDEDQFISAGNEMLKGVAAFWNGLNADRIVRNSSLRY